MSDITLPGTTTGRNRAASDRLQDFHGSYLPYIVQLARQAITRQNLPTVPAVYPLRHAQIQEALRAMRQQAITLPGPHVCIARTLTVMLCDTLYHAPTLHRRIALDPRTPLEAVISAQNDTLAVEALNGNSYTLALTNLDAWRVDDSWTYVDPAESSVGTASDERTIGHILCDIDSVLQTPNGFEALLNQREESVPAARRSRRPVGDALTPLLTEYWEAVRLANPSFEMSARRVQVLPLAEPILHSTGPFAMVADDATLDHCAVDDGDWVRITKLDGLPFAVRRSALSQYQLQDIRGALTKSQRQACGVPEVTVLDARPLAN